MFKKHFFILFIASVIFGGVYIWLATPVLVSPEISPRFDWPDETANYFWSSYYATTGNLVFPEPLNIVAENQIHPRSINVRSDGALVPGSFLGLILIYGFLAKIFTTSALIYFTPVLSILGVLAFYGIIKRVFDDRVALVSALLLLIHPAWWYYSVEPMLPNIPFISFLLLSIYFLVKSSRRVKLHQALSAGFLFGLAVAIRPSELIWMVIVFLAVLILVRNRIKFSQIVLFLIVAGFTIAPSLMQQQAIYGDYLTSGYTQLQNTNTCQSCQVVKAFLLPFGFHPSLMVSNLWVHYLSRMWWLSLLTLLGLISFLVQTRRQKEEIFGYVMMSLAVFGWLGAYYGSWEFSDKLTIHLNTLGISYIRYFLPLFILAIPFTATGIIWFSNIFKKRWRNFGVIIFMAALLYASTDLVLSKKPDSVLPVRERVASYVSNASVVNSLTEEYSIIVTVRKDKLFFPERRVIHTFEALSLNTELSDILLNVIKVAPVYYYALGPEPVLEFENGLKLEEMERVGQEILYQVYE